MEGKQDWRPGATVCRCCLAEGCYKDISTEYFWMGKKEVYADMLLDTFDLTIQYAQTGGPNSQSRLICEVCISRLRDAADFKRQVKECEQTFMQCLNPSTSVDIEVPDAPDDVKMEIVKQESVLSDDDDFRDTTEYLEDDDDLDDEPLMNLASKVPKREVDVTDLLDTSKGLKRKAKAKASPKKAKVKEIKATASKPKPEKKKKDESSLAIARRNAVAIVEYSTAYPFRLPENAVMCVYCYEEYPDPSEFRKHMNEEHDHPMSLETMFAHCQEGYIKADCSELYCKVCLDQFDRLTDVAEHLIASHKVFINLDYPLGIQPFKFVDFKYMCGICDMNFPCLRRLSRHTTSHYQNFTCPDCGKSYATMSVLKQHMKFSHTSIPICRRCQKTFTTQEEKREHMESSYNCWIYKCVFCPTPKRFLRWTEKEQHLVEVHGKSKRTHKCPECGATFESRYTYRIHFTTNHSTNCYVCSYCEKKFATKGALDEHVVIHTGLKQYECEVCLKTFPRKANLRQHQWIHSEVKRFECGICDKKFNQKVSFKSHMKTHHPEIEV